MITNNDIIQITTRAVDSLRNVPIDNVFHFRIDDLEGSGWTVADYAQIAADFFIGLHAAVSLFQSNLINWVGADFENLTNGVDIASYSPPDETVGAVLANPELPQVALSFQLVRSTRATRHGSKRFGGIADTIITDGSGENLQGTANIVALETYLSEYHEIVAGGGNACTIYPIILRRTPVGVPPTVYNDVASAVYRGGGSQNSRKRLL